MIRSGPIFSGGATFSHKKNLDLDTWEIFFHPVSIRLGEKKIMVKEGVICDTLYVSSLLPRTLSVQTSRSHTIFLN